VADAIIGPTLDGKKGRPDRTKGVATIPAPVEEPEVEKEGGTGVLTVAKMKMGESLPNASEGKVGLLTMNDDAVQ
jgi:hypothetical protein